MNIKNTMLKITTVIAVVFSFVACEDDFETVGGNVIGGPNFNADVYDEAMISATNNDLAPVQTNNLPVNLLGVYNDPVFGSQVASILTQVSLSAINPDFGDQPVLDSVVLNIPYFSTQIENDADGNPQYKLDSIYGNDPIKISVLETNFFMNQFDPETNFEQAQKYYSDLEGQIENNLTGKVLFATESFRPSDEEVIEYTETDTLQHAPRMKLKLNSEFFQSKIIDKEGSSELSSMANFRNYFRSIYLKAEAVGQDGTMMSLNLAHADAGITLYYTVQVVDTGDSDDDGDIEEMVSAPRSFKLNLGPARVNTFQQETPAFPDASNLYLKGGEGSMVIIDLFNGIDSDSDGISDELEYLRGNDWLINEANLEFFVNKSAVSGVNEPERLYLYDLTNNRFLADYVLDTPGQANAMTSVSNNNHLGPLKTDENGEGVSYKIKLTRHIDNILNKDSTNVRLGLVVAENVNLVSSSAVKQTETADVKKIPTTSVITPEATVLYGPAAQDDQKRLKLKIYYTESK
ncbi:protein of unknown function [Salinimicrobium catena]|uniref:DUF4270 domain-containing protein n=2 Tax=Salinimicrobium catena TaxID=390640 RepID=A0A1H5JBI0_9FLAO|nr:protein of unknown function [Salinimicrobium catena]SEE49883.1 protein of unknown function [Salinimicrobium catena]